MKRHTGQRAMLVILALLIGGSLTMLAASYLLPPQVLAERFSGTDEGTLSEQEAVIAAAAILRRARVAAGIWLAMAAAAYLVRKSFGGFLQAAAAEVSSVRPRIGRTDRFIIIEVIGIALLTIGGLLLRICELDQPMRYDESITWSNFIGKGPVTVLATYGTNNHPLHNLLAWVSTSVFGLSPATLRLPALIAGTLTVPAAYAAGRAIWNRTAGAAGAVAATALPYMIFLSINARGYALMVLAFVVCTACAAAMRRAQGRRRHAVWICFVLSAAAGLAAIPVMLYPLVAIAGWMLATLVFARSDEKAADDSRRRFLLRSLGAMGAIGCLTFIFYTPAFVKTGPADILFNQMMTPLPWREVPGELLERGGEMAALASEGSILVAIALGGLIFLELFAGRGGRRVATPLLPMIAAMIAIMLVQRLVPFPRIFSFLLPVAWMTAGAGAARLAALLRTPRALKVVAGSIAAVVVLIWLSARVIFMNASDLDESGTSRDSRAALAWLRANATETDRFIGSYLSSGPMRFYLDIDPPPAAAHMHWSGGEDVRGMLLRGSAGPGGMFLIVDENVAAADAFAEANVRLDPDSLTLRTRLPHGGRIYEFRR